jgi:hypothetical protein
MTKTERERESENKKSLPIDFATGPLRWGDMRPEEKYISRSLKIRRKVLAFLSIHEGSCFYDMPDLCDQVGNFAECSSETARRWIYQFTAPNAPYKLTEQGAGLVIWKREQEKS